MLQKGSQLWRCTSSRAPMDRARAALRENTALPRPKGQSLAMLTASSSLPHSTIAITGPNTSSFQMRMLGFTPTSTVGA